MQTHLTDQSRKFTKHLEDLLRRPVMNYDRSKLSEKVTAIKIDTVNRVQDLNTRSFFDYNIFPKNILTHLTQWKYENREMKVGDTILQQTFLPPLRSLSLKVLFGVRISEVIRETSRVGFSYETLEGHVERGISTFTIEDQEDGKPIFKIHTFSRPGNFLTSLAGPIFSVPYQTFCTRQGLLNVKRQLEQV